MNDCLWEGMRVTVSDWANPNAEWTVIIGPSSLKDWVNSNDFDVLSQGNKDAAEKRYVFARMDCGTQLWHPADKIVPLANQNPHAWLLAVAGGSAPWVPEGLAEIATQMSAEMNDKLLPEGEER